MYQSSKAIEEKSYDPDHYKNEGNYIDQFFHPPLLILFFIVPGILLAYYFKTFSQIQRFKSRYIIL
jgi:hypothetical protein